MSNVFARFARLMSNQLGRSWAFSAALFVVVVWAATGPLFHFSDTWQLVINTGTTVITFLMVFLIQSTQNRDSKAIHLKLDELVRAVHGARNSFIDVEDIPEQELIHYAKEFEQLHEQYATAAKQRSKKARVALEQGRAKTNKSRSTAGR